MSCIFTDLISIAAPASPPRKRGTLKGKEKDEKAENMLTLGDRVAPQESPSTTLGL